MAASKDDEGPALDIPNSCKAFSNQDSAALSDQEPTEQLEAMGCQDVSFGHNTPGRPSNLSVFCFLEKLRDGSENEYKLLLWVMGHAKDGKTRSKEDI